MQQKFTFDPKLLDTYLKWRDGSHALLGDLVESILNPISLARLQTHIAVIKVKELVKGFRVDCFNAVLIDSFTVRGLKKFDPFFHLTLLKSQRGFFAITRRNC
jgi:hypothetical protein